MILINKKRVQGVIPELPKGCLLAMLACTDVLLNFDEIK